MSGLLYIATLGNDAVFKVRYLLDKVLRRLIKVSTGAYPRWSLLPQTYIIKNKDGDFRCAAGTDHDYIIRTTTEYELREYMHWKGPGVFIDVGAHIGKWSVFVAKQSPGVQVFALEPNPETFSFLVQNIRLNNLQTYIQSINVGVYDKDGTMPFSANAELPAVSKLDVSHKSSNSIDISVRRLDSLCGEYGIAPEDVRLIKIDVEGAELGVIDGVRGCLMDTQNIRLICEIFNEDTQKQIDALLRGYGFTYTACVAGSNYIWDKA